MKKELRTIEKKYTYLARNIFGFQPHHLIAVPIATHPKRSCLVGAAAEGPEAASPGRQAEAALEIARDEVQSHNRGRRFALVGVAGVVRRPCRSSLLASCGDKTKSQRSCSWTWRNKLLPPSQIVSHSRNLRESKHFYVRPKL